MDHNRDYAQVLRETDQDTLVSLDYLYGDDLIRQSQDSADEKYYLYDGLGSTRALSDSTGTQTDTYDYEAFGSILFQNGTTENNYLFTGEQYDHSLNQQYLRARYYDPHTARFTQQDTWMGDTSDPATLHKYLYTNSNPVNGIDPSGNMTLIGQISTIGALGYLATISNPSIQIGQSLASGWDTDKGPSSIQAGWLVLSAAMDLNRTMTKILTAKAKARDKGDAAVIGESMPRVMAYANAIGAEYWKIPGKYINETANRKWINRVMDRGLAIIDIGSAQFTATYPEPSSPYYKLELREIADRGYTKYYKLY